MINSERGIITNPMGGPSLVIQKDKHHTTGLGEQGRAAHGRGGTTKAEQGRQDRDSPNEQAPDPAALRSQLMQPPGMLIRAYLARFARTARLSSVPLNTATLC